MLEGRGVGTWKRGRDRERGAEGDRRRERGVIRNRWGEGGERKREEGRGGGGRRAINFESLFLKNCNSGTIPSFGT